MVITIIGLGLIGGSIAIDLKKMNFASRIYGVENNPEHAKTALDLSLIDEIKDLNQTLKKSQIIIIAIPVDDIADFLPHILDYINPDTIVIDVGSTKSTICDAVNDHKNRKQFVAAHPIAGTEYTGPESAHSGLFNGKINIICDKSKSSNEAVKTAEELFNTLGMRTVFMESKDHDKHIAYVSHLSHISSFALGLTVLEIEKDEKNIFRMAGAGFASTVRLAKSSPEMWEPIFRQNKKHLTLALDEYIHILQQYRQIILDGNREKALELMKKANLIGSVLDRNNHFNN